MKYDLGWHPVDLMGDRAVAIDMTFFRGTSVAEELILTQVERPQSGEHRLRFRFDRKFHTTLTNSPDHLTPVSVLPLAQKLYYYLLADEAGHDVRTEGERFKIWPTEFSAKIPVLLTRRTAIEGELVEQERKVMPVGRRSLYPGIRPARVKGTLTIDRSMQFVFTCFIYDLTLSDTRVSGGSR